jgi:hypothetical protein
MLVDHPPVLEPTFILRLIGQGKEEKRITTGVYQISHFGSSNWPFGVAEDSAYTYGVCDNYEQVIARYPHVNDTDKKFVITLTPIVKAEQDSSGGWRWHEWGPYIGTLSPQHEYIFDEDATIQQVYVYHIYEIA